MASLLYALFFCVVVAGESRAQAPTLSSTPTSVSNEQLVTDLRLKHKVTLDETAVSMEQLLEKLRDETVTLSCDPSCASQKLQVRLKDRPLYAVMEALADLLPGTWKPAEGKAGYRLEMTEEAAQRRKRWWQMYLKERERALKAQRAFILSMMRRPPYQPKPGGPQLTEEVLKTQEFWRTLPAALQERVANQLVDNVLYRSGVLYLGTSLREGAVVVPFNALPQEAQKIARENASALANETIEPSIIRFNNAGYVVTPRIATTDGIWRGLTLVLDTPILINAPAISLDHRGIEQAIQRLGRAAPAVWKQFAAYQESRVWPNDPPANKSSGSVPPRRAEVLDWLADKGDIEFVADFYSRPAMPLFPAEKKQPLSRPLKQELDYRAAEQDMSWKQRDNKIYLFRNNRWYRDDYLEVPASTLKRLMTMLPPVEKPANPANTPSATTSTVKEREQARKQMDLAAEIVTALTPFQIANGLTYYVREEGSRTFNRETPTSTWRPFSWIADRTLSEYNTILFYSGLTPSQRTALFEGHLSAASLSPLQQQQALFVLPDLQALVGSEHEEPLLLGLQLEKPIKITEYGYNSSMGGEFPLQVNLVVASASGTGR